jgi:hypothetical protein
MQVMQRFRTLARACIRDRKVAAKAGEKVERKVADRQSLPNLYGLMLGEMVQEVCDFGNADFLGVKLVLKQNLTFYPLNIKFFCTISVAVESN